MSGDLGWWWKSPWLGSHGQWRWQVLWCGGGRNNVEHQNSRLTDVGLKCMCTIHRPCELILWVDIELNRSVTVIF